MVTDLLKRAETDIICTSVEYNGCCIRPRIALREGGGYLPGFEIKDLSKPDKPWFGMRCTYPSGGFAKIEQAEQHALEEGKDLAEGILPDMDTEYQGPRKSRR